MNMNKETNSAVEIAERIIDSIIEEKNSPISILRLYYRLITLVKNEDELNWIKA